MTTSYGLIDQSTALAAKAAQMARHMSKLELLQPVSKLAWDPYTAYAERRPFLDMIYAFEQDARAVMKADVETTAIPLDQQIEELKTAALEDKGKVLRSIPIVTVPVGASYLGVSEAELHRFKYSCIGLFGARYAGRQCYSMEELLLIAQNPTWMDQGTKAKPQKEYDLPELGMLDHVTFVGEDIATAFTNLTDIKLSFRVRASYRNRNQRLYRLADLKKIRIAKLGAIA